MNIISLLLQYWCAHFRKNIAVFTAIHGFIHLNTVIALSLALVIFVSGIEAASNNEVSLKQIY